MEYQIAIQTLIPIRDRADAQARQATTLETYDLPRRLEGRLSDAIAVLREAQDAATHFPGTL